MNLNRFHTCRWAVIACYLAAFTWGFASIALAADSSEVEAEVKLIRKYYAEVEALQELRKQDIEFQCKGGPMQGVLTLRFRRDTGKVVRLDLGYLAGDHGGSDEMYYYREGQVFFVLTSDSWWQFSGKKEGETIDTLRERRYYFSKGKCIRVLEKKVVADKPEQLRALAAKEENRELDLNEAATKELIIEVMKKAVLLPKMTDVKEVVKFFCE